MRVVALSLLVLSVFGDSSFETPDYHNSIHTKVFRRWKHFFNKEYANILDEAYHFTVFAENWRYIHEVNSQKLGYELGLNQFADLTGRQFREYVHGKSGSCLMKGQKTLQQREIIEEVGVPAPASVDWTKEGKVTPVKNQGQCGSCWAFSTTGSIESQTAIKTGKLVSLSEQQLVDCSRAYGNQGCNGGLMDSAFKYVKAEGGLCSEEEYPYKAKDGVCKRQCGTKYDPISGYTDVQKDSETSLVNAVVKGPVSIAIEADQQAFQFYKRGVLTGNCGTRLDHGVLVVGYGTEGSQEYWKVKNSWGKTWGEEGYIRMCKNCNKNRGAGECGILEQPSYPTIA